MCCHGLHFPDAGPRNNPQVRRAISLRDVHGSKAAAAAGHVCGLWVVGCAAQESSYTLLVLVAGATTWQVDLSAVQCLGGVLQHYMVCTQKQQQECKGDSKQHICISS